MRVHHVLTALMILALAAAGWAGSIPEKEPGPKSKGKQYQSKSKDGLVFHYYVPKSYDPEAGANLTLILHGSNLDCRWGFANHAAGKFRPDDIVVSPDGTTPNGRGGYNFLGEKKDADRVHDLIEELKKTFKINGVYLYGHSQGSFFAFYYAGQYPDDVNGVVGHASGVWNWTQLGPRGHHQAIVLMHGTQDPVVPYGQSVGGYEAFRKAKYPMVRLRSLEGWNHWPAEHNGPVPHTSQQLAWCEGMTTEDPARLEACFEVLAANRSKERHDYAAVYTLAQRIATFEGAPQSLVKHAAKAAAEVEKLAEKHVAAIKIPKKPELTDDAWIGHLPVFLRSFMDVPAREKLAEDQAKLLEKHKKAAIKNLQAYYQKRGRKPADAFAAGLAAIKNGFLYFGCANNEFLNQLDAWAKQGKQLRIGKQALKEYSEVVPVYRKALKEGYRAFDGVNSKAAKL